MRMGPQQNRETLAENGLRAVDLGAAELADEQTQNDSSAVAGEVRDRAAVAGMDAVGRRPAPRARCGRGRGDEEGDGGTRGQDEVCEAQAGTWEKVKG